VLQKLLSKPDEPSYENIIFSTVDWPFNHSYAQQANSKSTATNTVAKDEKPSPANLVFNPDENVVTEHTTTIKGQKISYKATTGTMPVWDEGKAIAGLFYTYYERSDVKDRASRPLVISMVVLALLRLDAYCIHRT
jgi:carboxypeptidase C (cathepsin A)